MTDREKERNEARRRNVVEKMWLNYYNNELLAQGLITESMQHKMRYTSTSKIALDHKFDQGQFFMYLFPVFPQVSIHIALCSAHNTPRESGSRPSGSVGFPKR